MTTINAKQLTESIGRQGVVDLDALIEGMRQMDEEEKPMNRDPLEDEIEWSTWTDDPGGRILEGTLGKFSKRFYFEGNPLASEKQAQQSIAHHLLKAVYEGREREKREADKQFVGVA